MDVLKSSNTVDVLIVGAGPVGLFLANECARRALTWRIIEKNARQSEHSKALAVMPHTLEILDMAGLVEPFLQAANRTTNVALFADRNRLAKITFAPKESQYPFIAMVPQNVTESLLVHALESKGGAVEYETSLVSAAEGDDGVAASVERSGRRETIKAAFLVGCDGAHSAVRKILHLPFEGGEYDATFMLADVETNAALSSDEMQLCSHEDGPLAIFPISNARRRVVATVMHAAGDAPSLDLVRTILAKRGPNGIRAHGLNWSSYFRVHHRHVASLQSGNVFLAGDAAHIHSPFGGQGMNTGLHDAWNLAWKLDLAVRGYAEPALLDSYSVERLPVIRRVIATTDLLTKAMGTSSKVAQALRNALIPIVTRLPSFRHTFVERLSQLGVAYGGSPIIEGHGERCFEQWMRGGQSLRSRFVLVYGSDGSALAEEIRNLASEFADTLELRAAERPGVTLIRPDGYTAFISQHGTINDARLMREVLQRQVTACRAARNRSVCAV